MKHLNLFENFNDIHSICKQYDIENYTINEDGSIDVDGDVNLNYKELTKLPLKFRNVTGYFYCSDNQLTSLEGAPKSVGGHFECPNNQLTSLEGGPQEVGGTFYCSNNYLISLEDAPQSVGGGFYSSYNQLTSLEGFPDYVGGYFGCDNNPIYNIWQLFKQKKHIEYFNFLNIITDVDGKWAIILDRLNSFLEDIGKPKVKKIKGYITI
jgi:hypothetical protein